MAKLKLNGLEEYEKQLLHLRDVSHECIGKAVYDGAKEVADAVRREIRGLPIDERHVSQGEMLHGITAKQKAGLLDGFGISKMEDENGYLHVKLGFAGHNDVKTRMYPAGQPNSVIARSVNSGTSFRAAIPFVDMAVRSTKNAAEQAMKNTLDKEIGRAIK